MKEGSLLLPLPPLPNLHETKTKRKPIPRILFNRGSFTVDGPMVAIFLSLCLIFSSFGGLFVIPEIKYVFCFILLFEIAVILSVLGKNRCCIALFMILKLTAFIITLLSGFPMGYALITVEKPTKMLAGYLRDVQPEDLLPTMNIAVWAICVYFLFATLFSYLHFASLVETMKRVDEIRSMRKENSHPLPPPPKVITHFPIIIDSPPSSVSQFDDGDKISMISSSV